MFPFPAAPEVDAVEHAWKWDSRLALDHLSTEHGNLPAEECVFLLAEGHPEDVTEFQKRS